MQVAAVFKIVKLLARFGMQLYADYKEAKAKEQQDEWENRVQETIEVIADADAEGTAEELNGFFGSDDSGSDS